MSKDNDNPNITPSTEASKTNKTQETVTFALAQSHFLVGDITANAEKMRALALQAREQGADVIIFPELALLGYPPQDLLLRPSLSGRIKSALSTLSDIDDIVMIVGYPHVDHHGTFNSAAILHNGHQKGFYHKQILPNYGVFDERRYFDKGRNQVLFDYKGITIGLLICEDLWEKGPIAELKKQGADLIISLNASPFEIEKQDNRKTMLAKRSRENNLPIVYVNAVGGQDDLVFDGGSMAVQADGSVAHEAPRFMNQLLLATLDVKTAELNSQTKAP